MTVIIHPKPLKGSVRIPPSKSQAHRAIIAASLAKGKSVLSNIAYSDDILATIGAMEKIGVRFIKNPNQLIINGINRITFNDDNFIECNESGTTLRLVMPLLSLSRQKIVYTGKKSLLQRPLGIYETLFQKMNLPFQKSETSFILSGSIVPGEYDIPGNVSSQFVSGLLFALPLLKEPSRLNVQDPFESRGYVDMTIDMLKTAGVTIIEEGNSYTIPGNQQYKPFNTIIEGDYTQLANFAVMGLLNGDIDCLGVPEKSLQPDRRILDFIQKAKGAYSVKDNQLHFQTTPTEGTDFDVSQSPDIAPVLSILAAVSKGESRIENAFRLKYKESNRIYSMYQTMKSFGVETTLLEDGLIIQGKTCLEGGEFESFNDHRIVMAIATASVISTKKITIHNAEVVKKSYPDFFSDMANLGADIELIED
ncbi:MAG: 3-phosphoshikimate 1-carboxyvinyltransferase [Candidatus Izemoplasmatales bacterium]|nr:3-phosphoshikimate 1-carboxyvinyltransferase [Candidatus Izemoplasmatales bacterium]NLF49390.1 3-phosphoshikimate 1-carboxyvinyltransferase [Acholeplasmataceae bacterium]MDD4354381.1 3-phosphoshikimate 1-carboxyvinyltransferase [Candidatus Izemoplasmatales bacterium]MDD4987502.1 3-phosphoshikimate 1-carboxyvinyltransferase [Candidatus Izemoplasmatales bacterium]MDD5601450.1 3-phosphoshikimate 1-carboxyvinyltransferase [Candidatus Izemoplasmatales bacterium]